MIAAYQPSWYVPVMGPLSTFLIVASVAFLIWWVVDPPKVNRNSVAAGIVVADIAILGAAARVLYRIGPSAVPPLFSSEADAATAVAPYVAMGIAVALFLTARIKEWRKSRRG